MKRISVNRMIRNRLSDTKLALNLSYQYEDLANVLGGNISREEEKRGIMQNDIEQLQFLLNQLKIFNNKKATDNDGF